MKKETQIRRRLETLCEVARAWESDAQKAMMRREEQIFYKSREMFWQTLAEMTMLAWVLELRIWHRFRITGSELEILTIEEWQKRIKEEGEGSENDKGLSQKD